MEGIFFVLIGAALYSQAWSILGLYSEGRTMGIFTAGLGLLSLGTIMFGSTIEPTVLVEGGAGSLTNALTALVILWAVYAVGVGATGIWEFEDRAIGFYSSFLAVASVIVFLYFAISMSPGGEFSDYSEGLWLSMSAVPLVLTVISTITFFYLGFQFQLLRLVSGWFTLLGSIVIGLIGLGVVATAIA